MLSENRDFDNCLNRMIRGGFVLMIATVLIVCVFFSNIEYSRCRDTYLLIPNFFAFLTGICVFSVLGRVLEYDNHFMNKKKVFFISFCFLFFQVFLVWNYYFKTDWDVAVLMDSSYKIALGESVAEYNDYFSRYPNNLFLVYIFSGFIKIFRFLGLGDKAYSGILVFQCIISWLTGLMLYYISKVVFKKAAYADMTWILYTILVGLSPWVSIPYSDSMGLFFPTAILVVYVFGREGGLHESVCAGRWYVIAFLAYMGYKIKPQVFIVLIALIIIHTIRNIQYCKTRETVKKLVKKLILLFFGIMCSYFIVNTCINTLEFEINKERNFGMAHFFMMGMNTEGMGVWNGDDVDLSMSVDTVAERTAMNKRVAKERLHDMGIKGFISHMHRKLLTNYNDGTFCWGGEKEVSIRSWCLSLRKLLI